jgi:hypothetical protein
MACSVGSEAKESLKQSASRSPIVHWKSGHAACIVAPCCPISRRGKLPSCSAGRCAWPPAGPRRQLSTEIPIEGEPADAIVAAYADWLATSSVPKLLVKADPGALLAAGANREWPAQVEVTQARGTMVIDVPDPSKVPAIAGPFFMRFQASISFYPCLTPDDLAKSNLEELGRKYA